MIKEVCRIAACLALGEAIALLLPVAIPAPVIGLVLLFGWLCLRGGVPDALATLADQMLAVFGLFFVPAGVGIVACGHIAGADLLAIVLAVTVGTLVTVASTALAAEATTRGERIEGETTWADANS